MERPLVRFVLLRLFLVALPFVVWFAWAAWARRTGREMGATPWPWLAAAGAVLFGLSLMASAFFQGDTRDKVYVPGEVTADGAVREGRFETK
jgi:TRAP-type C4-dicarboxylate transport system permease small subunit